MRAREPGTKTRLHASLAISGGGKTWTLVNATPDVHAQVESFPALHPGPGRRETPLRNILLTDAELDHTIGLLLLREGTPLEVYATGAVLATLAEAFPVRRLLECYATIHWHEITMQGTFLLEDGRLRVRALPQGRKRPRFTADSKIDGDWVVGYRFEDAKTKGVAIYAPAVEAWAPELAAEFAQADCVFLDGTFWKEDEMIEAGVGGLTATAMGHLPISGLAGSARHLSSLRVKRRVYVHINNTNPVLDERSAEHRFLAEKGIEAGWDGMSMEV